MSNDYVTIVPRDNIMVAIHPFEKGSLTKVSGKEVTLKEQIKQKHKPSLNNFRMGYEIHRYGVLIGKARQEIQKDVLLLLIM